MKTFARVILVLSIALFLFSLALALGYHLGVLTILVNVVLLGASVALLVTDYLESD